MCASYDRGAGTEFPDVDREFVLALNGVDFVRPPPNHPLFLGDTWHVLLTRVPSSLGDTWQVRTQRTFKYFDSPYNITSMAPVTGGSTRGGTVITLYGRGFHEFEGKTADIRYARCRFTDGRDSDETIAIFLSGAQVGDTSPHLPCLPTTLSDLALHAPPSLTRFPPPLSRSSAAPRPPSPIRPHTRSSSPSMARTSTRRPSHLASTRWSRSAPGVSPSGSTPPSRRFVLSPHLPISPNVSPCLPLPRPSPTFRLTTPTTSQVPVGSQARAAFETSLRADLAASLTTILGGSAATPIAIEQSHQSLASLGSNASAAAASASATSGSEGGYVTPERIEVVRVVGDDGGGISTVIEVLPVRSARLPTTLLTAALIGEMVVDATSALYAPHHYLSTLPCLPW